MGNEQVALYDEKNAIRERFIGGKRRTVLLYASGKVDEKTRVEALYILYKLI